MLYDLLRAKRMVGFRFPIFESAAAAVPAESVVELPGPPVFFGRLQGEKERTTR